jgi:hypothetical protein
VRYTPEEKARLAAEVVRLMSEGGARSAFEAAKTAGVPLSTFVRWCGEDAALAERYAHAREDLIERMASEVLELSDKDVDVIEGKKDWAAVQKHRLQVETRKWLLSKLAPKRYGEKLELSGDAANPIAIRRIERVIVGNGPDAAD